MHKQITYFMCKEIEKDPSQDFKQLSTYLIDEGSRNLA